MPAGHHLDLSGCQRGGSGRPERVLVGFRAARRQARGAETGRARVRVCAGHELAVGRERRGNAAGHPARRFGG